MRIGRELGASSEYLSDKEFQALSGLNQMKGLQIRVIIRVSENFLKTTLVRLFWLYTKRAKLKIFPKCQTESQNSEQCCNPNEHGCHYNLVRKIARVSNLGDMQQFSEKSEANAAVLLEKSNNLDLKVKGK